MRVLFKTQPLALAAFTSGDGAAGSPARGGCPTLGFSYQSWTLIDSSPSSTYPASKKMLQQDKMNLGAEFPGHTVTLCFTKNWKTFPNWQLYFLSSSTVRQSPNYPHIVTNTSSLKFESLSTDFEFKKQMAVTCRDNPAIPWLVSKGLIHGSVLSGLLLVKHVTL